MSPCLKEIGTVPPHSVDFEGSAYAGVFDGQGDFDGLVLPATLEKVGANAFNGCQAIKEFTMTDKLTFVGNHAFDGCKNLEAVTFADDAKTEFEEHVFSNTAVKEVVIPSWLDTIPVRMFNGCIGLTSATLSEGIVEIDTGAFADTALTSVELPESCLYVRDSVFQNTPVTNIKFGSKLLSIGANVFVKDTHNDLMQSVTIPDSVKSVGEGAFGYYKDSDKGYAELCKEAEELGVPVQSLMGPTVANKDFILYGSKAAERYANENGMIYGGTDPTVEPEKPQVVLGELNNDNTVNASDAALILIAAASIGAGEDAGLTDAQKAAADVNHDGSVNASDAAIVLIYAAAVGAGQEDVKIEDFVK
jgi:hypothetical protein